MNGMYQLRKTKSNKKLTKMTLKLNGLRRLWKLKTWEMLSARIQMEDSTSHLAFKITMVRNGRHNKTRTKNLKTLTIMIGKVTKDGLSKFTAALGDLNSSIIKVEINIVMMPSAVLDNITGVDIKERTAIISKNLIGASIITNGVTTTDSMLKIKKDILTPEKDQLRISNNNHQLTAVHLEGDLTKEVTIAALMFSVIITNFMMVTIKKTKDLILKKLEAKELKL